MQCKVHPAEETELRCGKCEAPVCPKCYIIGPAGVRCRDCAAIGRSPVYEVSNERLALGIAAGLAVAVVFGYLLAAAYRFGFFSLWVGLFCGYAVGEVILRAAGRKRGPAVEIAAGLCSALGAVIGVSLWFLAHHLTPAPQFVFGFIARNPFYGVSVAVSVFCAVSRIRYF